MKVTKIPKSSTPFALHCANHSRIVTILRLGQERINHGGVPAVLTDGAGFYSAELMIVHDEYLPVAFAVNGYPDEGSAIRDAERR